MDFFPEAAEFFFVFRLDIIRPVFRMKVVGHVFRFEPRRREFLQRKIEKPRIVRLENQKPAGAQNTAIPFEKRAVRQASFRVPRLRPRVAEIDIEAVRLPRRQDFLQRVNIEYEEPHVRQPRLTHPLRGLVKNPLLRLYPENARVRAWVAQRDLLREPEFVVAVNYGDIFLHEGRLEPRLVEFPAYLRPRSVEPSVIQCVVIK